MFGEILQKFVFGTSLKKKLELPYAAGHYVPQLAELVYERNKDKKGKSNINLKGFIVGNPITNDYYDSKGLAEYAWSHAVVPDEVYNRIKKYCNFKNSNWSDDCNAAMDVIYSQYGEIDIYNIYAPKCLLNQTSASSTTRAFFENDQVSNLDIYSERRCIVVISDIVRTMVQSVVIKRREELWWKSATPEKFPLINTEFQTVRGQRSFRNDANLWNARTSSGEGYECSLAMIHAIHPMLRITSTRGMCREHSMQMSVGCFQGNGMCAGRLH